MAGTDDTIVVDPWPPAGPARSGGTQRSRQLRWPIALVLVWAALAVADVVMFHPGLGATSSRASHTSAAAAAAHKHTRASAPVPAPTKARAPARAAQALTPAAASAFGPAGPGSGDNTSNVSKAIDASTTTAWTTDWYRTAQFGGLQAGTGLLIDMGHPVAVTSVRIVLGGARGADLQVLTGKVPSLPRMRRQASRSNASGTAHLSLARPHRARYLLIWFTKLPPDSAGTFQASVYDVELKGISWQHHRRAGVR